MHFTVMMHRTLTGSSMIGIEILEFPLLEFPLSYPIDKYQFIKSNDLTAGDNYETDRAIKFMSQPGNMPNLWNTESADVKDIP